MSGKEASQGVSSCSAGMPLASAIPELLRCPRTIAPSLPADYVPMRNAWSANFGGRASQSGIAYVGVQGPSRSARPHALDLMAHLRATWAPFGEHGPAREELAQSIAAEETNTIVSITYWRDPALMHQWQGGSAFTAWRNAVLTQQIELGFFIEAICPRTTHIETISSSERFEGIAAVAEGPATRGIQEHGYWGSMRDRIPAAQTSPLHVPGSGLGLRTTSGTGRHLVVEPHDNLTLIRSGQDWSDIVGEERECYESEIEPALRLAMEALRADGLGAGCYSNRYMQLIDSCGTSLEKTFGLGHWQSLAHLERWAAHDPKHLKIFSSFLGMAKRLGGTKLRLFHEVMVLGACDQAYEYVNCTPRTGLTRASDMART